MKVIAQKGKSTVKEKSQPNLLQKTEELDILQQSCMQVILEINWFTTSKQVGQVMAQRMLDTVHASRRAVSLTKKLFNPSHPAVKAANAAKAAIVKYRDSMTIPVAAVPSKNDVSLMKEPGTRLILTSMIDEFTEQMSVLTENLMIQIKKLDNQLESIKAADKAELMDLYNEEDYPKSVTELVSVRGPFFTEVKYTADFEKLAPKTCQRAMDQLRAKLAGTVELAAADFAKSLLLVSKTVANQLSNRTRLMPDDKHPLSRLRNGEVVTFYDHDLNPEEVPEHHVLIEVRYKDSDLPDAKSKTEWFGPMMLADYKTLKPFTTDERKKVHASSIENLFDKMESFRTIGQMLGSSGKPIADALAKLHGVLSSAGNKNQVVEEVRNGNAFRSQLQSSLMSIVEEITSNTSLIDPTKRMSRIVKKKK